MIIRSVIPVLALCSPLLYSRQNGLFPISLDVLELAWVAKDNAFNVRLRAGSDPILYASGFWCDRIYLQRNDRNGQYHRENDPFPKTNTLHTKLKY